MKYKFQELVGIRPDVTNDYDWKGSFTVSEGRFSLELRELTERWCIEQIMEQYVAEVKRRFEIVFEYRIVEQQQRM